MPLVSPNPTLRDALAAYISQNRVTKSEAATNLGVDPMTLGRFLKTGRVIEANRRKLELGLARAGNWDTGGERAAETSGLSSSDIVLSDKVIAALEFLLSAARNARTE